MKRARYSSASRRRTRPTAGDCLVFVDVELATVKRRKILLQIAAVAVNQSLQELETFEAKIRIDHRRTPSRLIHHRHYDPRVWEAEGQSEKAVAYDFGRFLNRYATADIITEPSRSQRRSLIVAQLVAHNAEFDGAFLRKWFERLGLFLPASYRVFCTLHRAMWLFHEDRLLTPPDDFKLGTLCQYFGVPLKHGDAHDALADVRATVELYRRMTMLTAAREANNPSAEPPVIALRNFG